MNLIGLNHDANLFGVRMIWKGQPYGRTGGLIHSEDDPLVELWDLRRVAEPALDFSSQERAQYVQRYYASVPRDCDETRGLDLQMSVPAWKLDCAAMIMVRRFINAALDGAAAGKAPPR